MHQGSWRIAAPDAQEGTERTRMADGGRYILVVEDDADSRAALRALLELLGHRVEEADSGARALELAATSPPEIVLLDVGLPDLEGYEVAKRLRAAGGAEPPFVVAVTGYDRPEDRERARDAGCEAFVLKPMEPDALAALLAAAPRRRRGPKPAGRKPRREDVA
jgi:two-component system CheB/CheR fusion protein